MAYITGTNGTDSLTGTIGDDTLLGLDGNDGLYGGDGSDLLDGGIGNDQLYGSYGNDTLFGGDGNDVLSDDRGVNLLDGGDGNDQLYDYSYDAGQAVYGGLGSDNVRTYGAFSTLSGGDGDDFIYAYGSDSTLTGGVGDDLLFLAGPANLVSGDDGNDTINGYASAGNHTLFGGAGDDLIDARGPNNLIAGGTGNDVINSYGISSVAGDDGDDQFYVLRGADTLSGGAGIDTYRFASATNSTVTDFTAGAGGDVIDLSYLLQFLSGYSGPNPFGSGHLRLVQSGADTALEIDPDGTANGSVWYPVATLQGVTAASLTAENLGGYDPGGAVPVAIAGSGTTAEDTGLNGQLTASDPDSAVLTFSILTGPQFGSLVLNPDGSFAYTPSQDFNGQDSFTFTANDGTQTSIPVGYTITVTPVNDAPVVPQAVDLGAVDEDSTWILSPNNLLQGSTDADGDPLSVEDLSASSGTLIDNGDGTWSFTPVANDDTDVIFSYSVSDGSATVLQTATLDLTPIPDAPVGASDSFAVNEDQAPFYFIDVLANDTDADGNSIFVAGLISPFSSIGTWSVNSSGVYFSPNQNAFGTQSIQYIVSDGTGTTNSIATVTINILPVNDAPTVSASVDLGALAEDASRIISQAELLSGATDVDGDVLSVVNLVVSSGSLIDNLDGT